MTNVVNNSGNMNPNPNAVDWDARLEALGISVRKELRPKVRDFILPEWAKGWIALIPALIFLILFMIYLSSTLSLCRLLTTFIGLVTPAVHSLSPTISAALQNSRGGVEVSWGIQNYIKVLADPVFQRALTNTGLIVIISVPLTIVIGLLLAVCLHSIKPLQGFYQTIFFLPYVTNTIALGMVFNAMFSSSAGSFINVFLSMFGVSPQQWLTIYANKWNMFVVIVIYSVWNGLAFKILVFMSGLSAIDRQYYDAAESMAVIKSPSLEKLRCHFCHLQILYITITSFIGACKSYSQIISLFGKGAKDFGGSDKQVWITVVGYIVKYIDSNADSAAGRGAAGCVILLGIVLLITLAQFAVSKNRVYY